MLVCVSTSLTTVRLPVWGSQLQAHWFLLKTIILKNSSQIYSFIFISYVLLVKFFKSVEQLLSVVFIKNQRKEFGC